MSSTPLSITTAGPDRIARPTVRERLAPHFTPTRIREALIAYLFLAPFLILFFVFVVRSIIYSGYMSFFDWKIMQRGAQKFIEFKNYQELFKDSVWWESLRNTSLFAVYAVIGTTLLALGTALLLQRRLPGSNWFRAIYYAPSILSVGVVTLIWGWLMNTNFGTLNFLLKLVRLPPVNWTGDPNVVLFSLALVTIWWGFGFPMLVFMAGLQNIPEPLYEAARIDGAAPLQLFLYITLPLLRPTLLFVTVTGFIAHFQVFGQPYFMTNSGGPGRSSYTAILYLYDAAWEAYRMGYASAVAFTLAGILLVITLIQFFFFGRRSEA